MAQSLFRSIRMKLLGEGKLLRYLTYAIGEILLIIIGIMIALQLNNWNEAQKDRLVELKILQEIQVNLQSDLRSITEGTRTINNIKNSCQGLLDVLAQDLPFDETYGYYLAYLSMYPHFRNNTSGYEVLKNKGLEFVSNDELRRRLTNLYEVRYPDIARQERGVKDKYMSDVNAALKIYQGEKRLPGNDGPASLSLYEGDPTGMYRAMVNFERFKQDTEFHWLIRELHGSSNLSSRRHVGWKSEIESLIELLQEEIN